MRNVHLTGLIPSLKPGPAFARWTNPHPCASQDDAVRIFAARHRLRGVIAQ